MKHPKELSLKNADKSWTIWGPCSGGWEAYLLYQGHVFFHAHYGTHGESRDGVEASAFLKQIQERDQYPEIQKYLISLGYTSSKKKDTSE